MPASFLLRVDDEEYAQAGGEPGTAFIVSAGYLPLRIPTGAGGVHHRPRFPGTTVQISEARYEVVDEETRDGRVVYTLQPWPSDQIIRELVLYTPALIASLREERRRVAHRERGRRLFWPLYPLLGALPEAEQIRACDRWGLSPLIATCLSATAEVLIVLSVWASLSPAAAVALMGLSALIVLVALLRIAGATITAEVSGSPVVAFVLPILQRLGRRREGPDPTLLPMTRAAFWARLALPDRQKREADGSLTVRSVLPHLSWTVGQRVAGEAELWWRVVSVHTAVEHGRLVYTYHLAVEGVRDGATTAEAPPPRATAYQDEVIGEVRREWGDLRSAFGALISLLPADVQERAVGHAGGPASLRTATFASAAFCLAAAVWMALEPTVLNLGAAAALGGDAGWRLWRSAEGRYAPSLFGRGLPRYLRPERVSYHAHREAERQVL